jgi:hypothetical protein
VFGATEPRPRQSSPRSPGTVAGTSRIRIDHGRTQLGGLAARVRGPFVVDWAMHEFSSYKRLVRSYTVYRYERDQQKMAEQSA